jgi:DNA modification methylase
VLAGEKARWSWTDPPYGVEYKGGTGLTIENDAAEDLPELLRRVFSAMDAHLVEGAPIYVAHPSGPLSFVFAEEWKRVGWKWHQTLTWVKQTFVLGHADYHHQHEPILYGWKGKNRFWYGGRDKASVLFFDRPARNAEHPTMKPVGLVADGIQNSSRRGDRGYEPFSGSGTTLAAAEQTGRLVSAIELAPKYVAVALERMAAMGLSPRQVT